MPSATFNVTYGSGASEVVEADGYRESGAWLIFSRGGRDEIAISADSVRRIDRTDPPSAPADLDALTRRAGGAWLVVSALASAVLGVADFFGADNLSGRVLGALLAVGGLAAGAGARALLTGGSKGRPAAVLGAMLAAAVPVVLLAAQWAGRGSETAVRISLVAMAVVSIALATRLWVGGARPRLPSVLRGFVAAGVLVGLFQFWYDKEFVPASREAGITEVVALEASGPATGRALPEFVTATIDLENISGTKVRVMGSNYSLWSFDPGQSGATFVASGRLKFGNGNWLSPNQAYTETMVLPLPDGAAAGLRFDLQVHVVKGNRVPRGRRVRCPEEDCPVAWKVGESSLVNRLTREDRYLVQLPVAEPVRVTGSPDAQQRIVGLETCLSREPDQCPKDPLRELDRIYGRVVVGASTELVLERTVAQAPAPSGG